MPLNMITQTLMNQLKNKLPKQFQTVNALMQNNANPQEIVQQMMLGASPEQKQNLFKQAKNYGVPDEILAKLKNMK